MTERLYFHFSLSCIGEGNGNPLQCSCLENPRDRGAWSAAIYGVAQSRTRLKWFSSSSSMTLDLVKLKAFLWGTEQVWSGYCLCFWTNKSGVESLKIWERWLTFPSDYGILSLDYQVTSTSFWQGLKSNQFMVELSDEYLKCWLELIQWYLFLVYSISQCVSVQAHKGD